MAYIERKTPVSDGTGGNEVAVLTCREAAYSEDVLEYMIGSYLGEEYILTVYKPLCYMAFDGTQGVIYQEQDNVRAETIEKYGFAAIPNLYGLMSEEALEASGIMRIRRQPYLDLYGQGVLIGFVDTGIDYTHKAFRSEDGRTRIVSIWDQTVQDGEGPEGFPYGQVYEREEIDRALGAESEGDGEAQVDPYDIVPERDGSGHGTFLASVAAGGENRREEFSGVAPLSELVVVKCKQAKKSYRKYYGVPENVDAFQENDILAGISYIFQVAKREKKPVVICLGIGTNTGCHSGGTNLTVFLDRYMAAPGAAIITCIGNEGNAKHHHAISTANDVVGINVEKNMDGFMAQLWWSTPGSLEISVTSPSGETVRGIYAHLGERYEHRFVPENTSVSLYFGVAQAFTRNQVVVFRFQNVRAGIWKIGIGVKSPYDSPRYHIWLPIRQFLSAPVEFLQPSPDVTLCNPGTGKYVLSVSAYNVTDDALYLQAGRGFSPMGYVKPEIVLPGVNILGALPGGGYGTMSGTSVSAAFATGIAALFMQQGGDEPVSGIALREIFIRGAVPRGEPYPNTEWGFGTVNAYASLTDY